MPLVVCRHVVRFLCAVLFWCWRERETRTRGVSLVRESHTDSKRLSCFSGLCMIAQKHAGTSCESKGKQLRVFSASARLPPSSSLGLALTGDLESPHPPSAPFLAPPPHLPFNHQELFEYPGLRYYLSDTSSPIMSDPSTSPTLADAFVAGSVWPGHPANQRYLGSVNSAANATDINIPKP